MEDALYIDGKGRYDGDMQIRIDVRFELLLFCDILLKQSKGVGGNGRTKNVQSELKTGIHHRNMRPGGDKGRYAAAVWNQ